LVGIGRCGGGAAVGETQNRPFQLSFNGSLKVDFQGTPVTSSETGPFRRAVPRDRAPKPAEALAVRGRSAYTRIAIGESKRKSRLRSCVEARAFCGFPRRSAKSVNAIE